MNTGPLLTLPFCSTCQGHFSLQKNRSFLLVRLCEVAISCLIWISAYWFWLDPFELFCLEEVFHLLCGSAGLHVLLEWCHLVLDVHALLNYLSIQFGAQISQIRSWCISAWLFWNSLALLLCSLLEALLELHGRLSNYKWSSHVSNCSWGYAI